MITAQDLMIGDWVYYKDKKQMPCRVISIIGKYIRFDDGTPQDWMSDVKNFTPIPLTAEILEKNGFVKQWNNNWQLNDYHSIIISEISILRYLSHLSDLIMSTNCREH